ncbi:Palmitoyl protein thioesterase [Trinorchestia longiramus]|nr:Palmitoyl protein thioesterase [Trinorchestia longiramus]
MNYYVCSQLSASGSKMHIFQFILPLLLWQLSTAEAQSIYLPVVLWHGMGDSCCYPFSMGHIKKLIQEQHNGTYVYSVMIGNSIIADAEHSILGNANDQVAEVCQTIQSDPLLANGYHAIGFSQGGQFLRAVAQRCGGAPRLKNLITVGGQHQGVFGVPPCPPHGSIVCEYFRKLLHTAAYERGIQNRLIQAQYWHDPLDEEAYREGNILMPDINQENSINEDYKQNLMSLENFVLAMFSDDHTVIPRESSWFGFYKPGQDQELQTLQESTLYTEDRLGLKALDEAGKLHFITSEGDHMQFTDEWFIENIIPYLN